MSEVQTPNPPLITVGVTCYNAETTISKALQSAREQDWSRLEIVVVDDCSTDRSTEIVGSTAAADDRIRLICHDENLGPGAARQTILENAHGEYLAFFDDDDHSAADRLAVQYRRLADYRAETGGAPVVCYASGARVYENGFELEVDAIGSRLQVPIGSEVINYLLYNGRSRGVFYGAGTPACALMASTEMMRAVGGFDPAFRRVEDAEFAVRVGLEGGHFIGCPQRLYTQRATHAPDKSAEKNYRAEMQLLEKYKEYLDGKNRYDFARNWFTVRYHHFNGDRMRMVQALVGGLLKHPLLVTRQLLTSVPARAAHERRSTGGQQRR
jgi:glycosyltransferase involved in cell wall biosynthesis